MPGRVGTVAICVCPFSRLMLHRPARCCPTILLYFPQNLCYVCPSSPVQSSSYCVFTLRHCFLRKKSDGWVLCQMRCCLWQPHSISFKIKMFNSFSHNKSYQKNSIHLLSSLSQAGSRGVPISSYRREVGFTLDRSTI